MLRIQGKKIYCANNFFIENKRVIVRLSGQKVDDLEKVMKLPLGIMIFFLCALIIFRQTEQWVFNDGTFLSQKR